MTAGNQMSLNKKKHQNGKVKITEVSTHENTTDDDVINLCFGRFIDIEELVSKKEI